MCFGTQEIADGAGSIDQAGGARVLLAGLGCLLTDTTSAPRRLLKCRSSGDLVVFAALSGMGSKGRCSIMKLLRRILTDGMMVFRC